MNSISRTVKATVAFSTMMMLAPIAAAGQLMQTTDTNSSASSMTQQNPPFNGVGLQSDINQRVATSADGNMDLNANANADVPVEISLSPDRPEALPGDTVNYLITVKNPSSQELTGLTLAVSFDANQMRPAETQGATVSESGISWTNGSLAPNEEKNLQFVVQLNPNLLGAEIVRTSVDVRNEANGSTLASAENELIIIPGMPVTGPGDFVSPLEDTSRFLSPFRAAGGASSDWFKGLLMVIAALGIGGLSVSIARRSMN